MNKDCIGKSVGKYLVVDEVEDFGSKKPKISLLFVKYQVYSFYLRFAKGHFTPCSKCQDSLHKDFTNGEFMLTTEDTTVELHGYPSIPSWTFYLNFMRHKAGYDYVMRFIPCRKCQEELTESLKETELIMGNKDYSEIPIEFSRKWEFNDQQPLAEVEKVRDCFDLWKCEICDEVKLGSFRVKGFEEIFLCEECGKLQQKEFEKDQKSLKG